MKNTIKRLLVVLCILTFAVSLCACGKEDTSLKYDEATLVPEITQYVMYALPQMSVESIKANEASLDDETFEMYMKAAESYEKARAEIGDIASVDGVELSSDEKAIIALANVTGTTGKTAQIETVIDKRMSIQSITVNVNRSFGELMQNAALNTLLGMGTVFIVLILIAFIISLFKYISEIEAKLKEKKEKTVDTAKAVDNAVAQIIETEQNAAADDLELVAVISAAIAAYEAANGNSGDGYVVRSIKKRF